jgi:hypothetical protein
MVAFIKNTGPCHIPEFPNAERLIKPNTTYLLFFKTGEFSFITAALYMCRGLNRQIPYVQIREALNAMDGLQTPPVNQHPFMLIRDTIRAFLWPHAPEP